MVAAVPLTYNFYHPDGSGRDGFIHHSSQHQNANFNYVPKAPTMPGNEQAGMASSLPAAYSEAEKQPTTAQVVGYTGHFPGDKYAVGDTFQHSSARLMETFKAHKAAGGPPALPVQFPDLWPRPTPQTSAEYDAELKRQRARQQAAGHRIPGFAGFSTGHQHVAGFTYGAICAADGTPDSHGAVIGEGAPGLGRKVSVSVVAPNLQPGAALPTDEAKTKPGYCGHVPGRHFSSNFGKQFSLSAKQMLECNGRPSAGGVADPGVPYYSDTDGTLAYPAGHVGRPAKCMVGIAGYAGFRPQTTPFNTIPGAA